MDSFSTLNTSTPHFRQHTGADSRSLPQHLTTKNCTGPFFCITCFEVNSLMGSYSLMNEFKPLPIVPHLQFFTRVSAHSVADAGPPSISCISSLTISRQFTILQYASKLCHNVLSCVTIGKTHMSPACSSVTRMLRSHSALSLQCMNGTGCPDICSGGRDTMPSACMLLEEHAVCSQTFSVWRHIRGSISWSMWLKPAAFMVS